MNIEYMEPGLGSNLGSFGDGMMTEATGDEVTIILTGVSGVGKSTLFGNLIGQKIDGLMDPNPLTDEIGTKEIIKNGIKVTLVDTPGILASRGVSPKMKKELKSLQIHLLVLCISMLPLEKFSRPHNRKIIKCLHDHFGRNIWKRCIIVFTFSNELIKQLRNETKNDAELREVFKVRLLDTMEAVQGELSQLDPSIVAEVDPRTIFNWDETYHGTRPVGQTLLGIPAGFRREDDIPLPSAGTNWIDQIFQEMLNKCECSVNLEQTQLETSSARKIVRAAVGAGVGVVVGAMGGGLVAIGGGLVGMGVGLYSSWKSKPSEEDEAGWNGSGTVSSR